MSYYQEESSEDLEIRQSCEYNAKEYHDLVAQSLWDKFYRLPRIEQDQIIGLSKRCGCADAAEISEACDHDLEIAKKKGLL